MKNLMKLFSIAVVAVGLAACGTNNNGQIVGYDAYGNPIYSNGTQTGYVGQGGCVPLQSALTFTAQGASINSAVILAGMLPSGSTSPGQHGQVVMGGTAIQQQSYPYGYNYGYGALQLIKQSSNGTLQLQVSQNMITGTLQLNPAFISQMVGGYQMNYPYTYGNNAGTCVSSVAIDAVYSTVQGMPQGTIIQALVYLYLNNGQPVGPIPLY